MQYLGYSSAGWTRRNKKAHIEYLKECARLWREGNYCSKEAGDQQAQAVEARIANLLRN